MIYSVKRFSQGDEIKDYLSEKLFSEELLEERLFGKFGVAGAMRRPQRFNFQTGSKSAPIKIKNKSSLPKPSTQPKPVVPSTNTQPAASTPPPTPPTKGDSWNPLSNLSTNKLPADGGKAATRAQTTVADIANTGTPKPASPASVTQPASLSDNGVSVVGKSASYQSGVDFANNLRTSKSVALPVNNSNFNAGLEFGKGYKGGGSSLNVGGLVSDINAGAPTGAGSVPIPGKKAYNSPISQKVNKESKLGQDILKHNQRSIANGQNVDPLSIPLAERMGNQNYVGNLRQSKTLMDMGKGDLVANQGFAKANNAVPTPTTTTPAKDTKKGGLGWKGKTAIALGTIPALQIGSGILGATSDD